MVLLARNLLVGNRVEYGRSHSRLRVLSLAVPIHHVVPTFIHALILLFHLVLLLHDLD